MGMTDAQAEAQMIRAWRCRRRKKAFLDWLKLAPCLDCGLAYPPECMDFDHRPGVVKKMSLSYGMNHEWAAVIAELRKCDLVCANCHRVRTTGRLKQRRAG